MFPPYGVAGSTRHSEDQVHGLFSLARGGDDEPFVVLQHSQPVLNICRVVAEAVCRFQSCDVHKGGGSDLCDQLFLAVGLRSEEGCLFKAIQSAHMARAVDQFVEGRGVVFGGFSELGQKRKRNGVVRGTVEGSVAVFVVQLYARSLQVVAYDGFCLLVGVCGLQEFGGVLRLQAFALVDMEDVVVPQERDFLLFASLFVLLFDPLPEDNPRSLLALLDVASCLLNLLECGVLAGTAQKHLIQKAVRLARRI